MRMMGRVDPALRRAAGRPMSASSRPRNELNDRSTMVKIAEYMAMECPIVAYPLPESRFTAAEAALYARPNDVGSHGGLHRGVAR